MEKVIYWVGVYTICITIRDLIRVGSEAAEQKRKELEQERRGKHNAAIGIQPNSEKKPMNKIGFSIDSK